MTLRSQLRTSEEFGQEFGITIPFDWGVSQCQERWSLMRNTLRMDIEGEGI